MKTDTLTAAVVACGFGLGALALNAMGPTARPKEAPETAGAAVWQQAGGLQRFWAGWCWLEGNLAWELRDETSLRRWLRRVVEAEPREFYFWANGARILAFDLPAWRAEREPLAPAAVRERWRREAAAEALAWLDRGGRWHGESAGLEIERGRIWLYGLGDRAAAAVCFARAAARPDAPEYAARLAAELAGRAP